MKRLALIAAAVALLAPAALAAVKPASLFTDHVVLQRDAKVNIWGTADAGEKVSVSIAGQKVETAADKDGRWSVQLAPMKAARSLEITIAGSNTVTLKDVAVGDVWVCSGQSNMRFTLGGTRDAAEALKAADHPDIRLFRVREHPSPEPMEGFAATLGWEPCTPASAKGITGVGYFFCVEVQKSAGVPIGLLESSWGGTPAQNWTSAAGLAGDPALKRYLDAFEAQKKNAADAVASYPARLAEWQKQADQAKADGKPAPAKPRAPVQWQGPTTLYNAMIHPMVRFPIKGAIWYQGEANAFSIGDATLYAKLFPAMIGSWRTAWGAEFPFFFVQLPNYRKHADKPTDTPWARIRESQAKALALPGTGMACTIDVGESGNLHPTDKHDVGHRLALVARATVYGEKIEYAGPTYDSMKVEEGKVRVKFTHVGGGLIAGPPEGALIAPPDEAPKSGADKLVGFAVAGADKVFHWADATIEPSTGSGQGGDSVVLTCPAVKEPVAVRYGWADSPECNLYNKAGLPAPPFRTDDW
ncbi:MAG: hypothetical protein BIFFINMI_01754 [Phycisphaerae bacterium]|nr:hypothetical protein [Phycisphaerae bacterium]